MSRSWRETRTMLRKLRRLPATLRGEVDLDLLVERGMKLGERVYVAPWALIDPDFCFLVELGDDTVVAPRAHILAHDASARKPLGYTRFAPVVIGARVFIGAGSLILPGVTIGDDAIVAAGSVVRRDVPPGKLAGGNPAEVVDDAAEYLQRRKSRIATRPCFERHAIDYDPDEIRAAIGSGDGYAP